jgi:hypothetical protein
MRLELAHLVAKGLNPHPHFDRAQEFQFGLGLFYLRSVRLELAPVTTGHGIGQRGLGSPQASYRFFLPPLRVLILRG